MTGHKTRSVFERYNIVSDGDLDMAVQRLDEISSTVSSMVATAGIQIKNAVDQQTSKIQRLTQCAPVAQVDRATVS